MNFILSILLISMNNGTLFLIWVKKNYPVITELLQEAKPESVIKILIECLQTYQLELDIMKKEKSLNDRKKQINSQFHIDLTNIIDKVKNNTITTEEECIDMVLITDIEQDLCNYQLSIAQQLYENNGGSEDLQQNKDLNDVIKYVRKLKEYYSKLTSIENVYLQTILERPKPKSEETEPKPESEETESEETESEETEPEETKKSKRVTYPIMDLGGLLWRPSCYTIE